MAPFQVTPGKLVSSPPAWIPAFCRAVGETLAMWVSSPSENWALFHEYLPGKVLSPKLTYISPENGWLADEISFWISAYFHNGELLVIVLGRVIHIRTLQGRKNQGTQKNVFWEKGICSCSYHGGI